MIRVMTLYASVNSNIFINEAWRPVYNIRLVYLVRLQVLGRHFTCVIEQGVLF